MCRRAGDRIAAGFESRKRDERLLVEEVGEVCCSRTTRSNTTDELARVGMLGTSCKGGVEPVLEMKILRSSTEVRLGVGLGAASGVEGQ